MDKKIIIITIILIAVVLGGIAYFWAQDKKTNQELAGQNQVKDSESQPDSLENSTSSAENNSLSDNATSSNATSTANLGIEILKQGTGEGAKNNDQITVHYLGTLEDGTKFDSSYDRGIPFQFTLGVGQVIAGWDQGILGMKVGEKRRLTIPPELAYGNHGVVRVIPPNATLIFEIELLQILK